MRENLEEMLRSLRTIATELHELREETVAALRESNNRNRDVLRLLRYEALRYRSTDSALERNRKAMEKGDYAQVDYNLGLTKNPDGSLKF